jgi:predicted dehydrogenase
VDQKVLRVAVVGASGIGKHHAKWYHLAGCQVVGFLGTSPSSCRSTAQSLQALFGFEGRGYCDWDELIQDGRPDLVDVCAPNAQHAEYIGRALDVGCHVLCEKPLVWRDGMAADNLLHTASDLVDKAEALGRCFGVCTQYAAGLSHYEQLYADQRGTLGPITSFKAEMETLARGRRRSPGDVWADMGSHPLSLLLGWMPSGYIEKASLRPDFSARQARVQFDFIDGNNLCRCDIVVRDIDEGVPLRRFGVNGFVVDCQGKNDADGVYRIALSHRDREILEQDYMSLLIENFVSACRMGDTPMVPAALGARNLELQLAIRDRAS